MTPSGDIAVDGQHLTLESRANTLPEIRPCKSKHDGSPRSNREMINSLIIGRPVPKTFLLKWPPGKSGLLFGILSYFFTSVDNNRSILLQIHDLEVSESEGGI